MALNLSKSKTKEIEYFFSEEGHTFGPFDLNQLLEKINEDTLVYREGIDWIEAKNLEELKKFFIKSNEPGGSFNSKQPINFKVKFLYFILGTSLVLSFGYLIFNQLFLKNAKQNFTDDSYNLIDSTPIPNETKIKLDEFDIYNEDKIISYISENNSEEQKLRAEEIFIMANNEYRTSNNPESAMPLFKKSILVYPFAKSYYELGNSLLDLKQFSEAVNSYQVAIKLNYQPLSKVLYNLACSYSLLENESESLKYLEMAIKNGYDNKNHMLKDKDLEFVRKSTQFFLTVNSKEDIPVFIKGTWVGEMSGKKLTLVLENVGPDNITGYNVLESNRRKVNGSFTKTAFVQPCSKAFKVILNEPGDDKWDGVFDLEFIMYNKSTLSDGAYDCSDEISALECHGKWESNNGKLKHVFTLTKD